MTVKEIAELFEQLELHLISSLKRNLTRHKKQEEKEGGINGTPEHWEAWQSAKLRDVQRFRRENEKILGQYSSVIDEETQNLIREQYEEGGADGFFHSSDTRLQSLIDEMQNNEARVEKAALRYMNDVYRQTILRTATAMNAGGMTLQQATDEATKDFLAQGINCVEYSNGRRVNIASYAEMALRTCSTRAMLMGEAKQRERLGIDTVLVSQYGACSDTCLPWQGRVYIDDVFQEYNGPRGGSFGVSRNGRQYMFLSVAIKGGLFHPNCRHTISTWIEGVSTMPKPMNIKKIERVSKLEKIQRSMERDIRKAKRERAGLTDPEAVKKADAKVKELQAELRDFIKKNSDVLRRDYWRERDDLAVKNPKNAVANASENGIINTEMYHKESDPREGFRFISDERFQQLTIEARKNGAIIIRGTSEVERHLDEMDASASTLGDVLMFRKKVCVSEVLEETYHFKQNLAHMNDDKGEPLRTLLNEIDAKKFILDNALKYQIPRNELEKIQKQLDGYQEQLVDYYAGGG